MKRIVLILLALCLMVMVVSASPDRLIDGADLLTSRQARSLEEKLDKISDDGDVDVIVITAQYQSDCDADYFDDYTDDYVILLLCMDVRTWEVLVGGKGEDIFTDDCLDEIADAFLPALREGDYAEAFETFADECDKAIKEANPFNAKTVLTCLGGSLIVGLVVALIATGIMRRKLKSVKFQRAAANYEKAGSMQLLRVQDIFLYSHVSRIKKPEPNKNTSRSFSGGSFHGGRGGRF